MLCNKAHFISEVSDGVEVRAVCSPNKFFHTKLGKPYLYISTFLLFFMLKKERLTAVIEITVL